MFPILSLYWFTAGFALAGAQSVLDSNPNIRCTDAGLRKCLANAYQGYTLCAEDDLNCKCNSVHEVADACYNGCPQEAHVEEIKAFVASQCRKDTSDDPRRGDEYHPPHYLWNDKPKSGDGHGPGKFNTKRDNLNDEEEEEEDPEDEEESEESYIRNFEREARKYFDSPEKYNLDKVTIKRFFDKIRNRKQKGASDVPEGTLIDTPSKTSTPESSPTLDLPDSNEDSSDDENEEGPVDNDIADDPTDDDTEKDIAEEDIEEEQDKEVEQEDEETEEREKSEEDKEVDESEEEFLGIEDEDSDNQPSKLDETDEKETSENDSNNSMDIKKGFKDIKKSKLNMNNSPTKMDDSSFRKSISKDNFLMAVKRSLQKLEISNFGASPNDDESSNDKESDDEEFEDGESDDEGESNQNSSDEESDGDFDDEESENEETNDEESRKWLEEEMPTNSDLNEYPGSTKIYFESPSDDPDYDQSEFDPVLEDDDENVEEGLENSDKDSDNEDLKFSDDALDDDEIDDSLDDEEIEEDLNDVSDSDEANDSMGSDDENLFDFPDGEAENDSSLDQYPKDPDQDANESENDDEVDEGADDSDNVDDNKLLEDIFKSPSPQGPENLDEPDHHTSDGEEDTPDEEEEEDDTRSFKKKILDKIKKKFKGSLYRKSERADFVVLSDNSDPFLSVTTDSDDLKMKDQASGATIMAACWVPLMVIFSCMTFLDPSPVVFFLMAGVATTYVKFFLPELVGSP